MSTMQDTAIGNLLRGPRMRIQVPLLLLAAMGASGCCATDKSAQLERVAKDWCLTIRASQVIPTYPLVEDLRPGDVFLTTTPIGEEVQLFESRGFLPLDHQVARLTGGDVFKILDAHYGKNIGVSNKVFPAQFAWDHVPDAKFPSYTFETSSTGGIDLAIPLQGVSVGLNYLRSAHSVGSVTLSEARTLGVPIRDLDKLVDKWAAENKEWLAQYGFFRGDPNARPVFVRIVTRIYSVGKVAVHLVDTSASGAQASAGTPGPLESLTTDEQGRTAVERQQGVVERLNEPLKLKFGGHVQVAAATGRSVTLNEDFERPVVIGYLAYDRLIQPDGSLGAAVSTLARVSGRSVVVPPPSNFNASSYLTAWYLKDEAKRLPLLKAWIQREHPGTELPNFIGEARFEDARLRCIRDLEIR
ncbi:MAG: hypothetical protein KF830_15115 [Planctomycetes bacterium]|nr:hypothetical protein [Planctomycetota bacterium]